LGTSNALCASGDTLRAAFSVRDDPLIQVVLQEVLEEAGFAVTAASGAVEALSVLDANGADFRALVTNDRTRLSIGRLLYAERERPLECRRH
jgi:DNA-binding NtrC family response regulator